LAEISAGYGGAETADYNLYINLQIDDLTTWMDNAAVQLSSPIGDLQLAFDNIRRGNPNIARGVMKTVARSNELGDISDANAAAAQVLLEEAHAMVMESKALLLGNPSAAAVAAALTNTGDISDALAEVRTLVNE